MREVSIRFADSAVADLEALRTWYSNQGVPEVGNRIVKGIFRRIEALRDYPEKGRIVPEFTQPYLRELGQKGTVTVVVQSTLPPLCFRASSGRSSTTSSTNSRNSPEALVSDKVPSRRWPRYPVRTTTSSRRARASKS